MALAPSTTTSTTTTTTTAFVNILSNTLGGSSVAYQPYTLTIQAETTIYQNEIKCRVLENDFNHTQNPTAYKNAITIATVS